LDVILEKGDDGLGITVAGYVSPDATNNGNFCFPFFLSTQENIIFAC